MRVRELSFACLFIVLLSPTIPAH